MTQRSLMPIGAQIVKLDPMSVPSRRKYGFDKLGVGEAVFFSFADVPGSRIITAVAAARKADWGKGKTFTFRTDLENKRYMICRTA